jgi:hypothetical protein
LTVKQEQEEGLARKKADEEASKVHVFPALDETSSHTTELIVTVESARHLPKMDVMGTCDAFCEVEWQGQKYKTTVKKNSYSPEWNETFAFPVKSISACVSSLSVLVMDWNMMSKSDLVGEVVIRGDTVQALFKGKHPVTMKDSFAVLNKGKAVIGNDKKPCVLNLKIRLVVPDEKTFEKPAFEKHAPPEAKSKAEVEAKAAAEKAAAEISKAAATLWADAKSKADASAEKTPAETADAEKTAAETITSLTS